MHEIKKSGFIAIVGRANVGKSTLLNKLVGQKIAIVSQKPQTTRTRILAVLNKNNTQMIFLDTPGFHKPKTRLGEYMVDIVKESVSDVDAVLFVVEPSKKPYEIELEICQKLKGRGMPVILVINKIDEIPKEKILEVISSYKEIYDFESIIPISAKYADGVGVIEEKIISLMPEGPQFYPQDMITDQPERHIAGEIIREKMLRLLSDEVPHGVAVEIEGMKEINDGKTVNISACIYCEKNSHKGIIIGKKGDMIKKIASYARMDLEKILDCKVFLEVFVKVREDWRNKNQHLRELGFKKD